MTDKQLLAIVRSFRRGILGRGEDDGMCFAVCAPLPGLLNMYGVECRLTHGRDQDEEVGCGRRWVNHYWLSLPDGRVIDPTIRQFNPAMPTVYIGAPLEQHTRWESIT